MKTKVFIIRKYVEATSVQQALNKEKKTPVSDCFIDESKKTISIELASAIGFHL